MHVNTRRPSHPAHSDLTFTAALVTYSFSRSFIAAASFPNSYGIQISMFLFSQVSGRTHMDTRRKYLSVGVKLFEERNTERRIYFWKVDDNSIWMQTIFANK